ncbi:tRNA threonylcarbamoyladenosine dehydratase [Rhodoferax fermentans]|uniref:tRNA threonylcarbamoyladenosine dehydratase n=1 Tax=Rhodoferax fermentans TaxID=28066 RepID=A0A1T1AV32_RHOFE|nr:tRNA threonylcarbamoyladenosine dehydratase [Rhodoferax fermentans]MBK1681965.1 tRNA threonylcarbamoyladenosine dehydratase [Rhodoferax fermentans]OOV07962.1 tRNA threonylcarbamoyladenosine dehydratase [Rhodoferax fermentans]
MVEDRRFAGLDRLFGVSGAQKVRQSHVAVVGVGGVGSWAAESLARSGVGRLTLIDLDHVAESNINRQIHATEASLGQAKVMAMRDRIHTFFPDCQVNCIDEFATPANWPQLLPAGVDAVIDACDQWHVKTVMANWAIKQRAIFVASGAAGGKRHAHLTSMDDLSQVTHDPLLSKVRYQLRKNHGAARDAKKIGLACVFSREPVAPPDASCGIVGDGSLNCHGFGSLVTVTATFGQCAAGYVLNKLADT